MNTGGGRDHSRKRQVLVQHGLNVLATGIVNRDDKSHE